VGDLAGFERGLKNPERPWCPSDSEDERGVFAERGHATVGRDKRPREKLGKTGPATSNANCQI